MEHQYNLEHLLYLMARLRDPKDGCPWDLAQDYCSITPSTIEEAYEVVDAIERQDFRDLQEELGDLLFQVIFYSQLAEEDTRFNFHDIVDCLTEKLIRRHPHVFPDGSLESRRVETQDADQKDINNTWESIKSQERIEKGKNGLLDDIPNTLPAMFRAYKMQKRAAKVGFDWPNIGGVVDKLYEELGELKAAIDGGDKLEISDELGDLMFTCVNIARHVKVDPEQCLRQANNKFFQRFHGLEKAAERQGASLENLDIEVLEAMWAQAKESTSSVPE